MLMCEFANGERSEASFGEEMFRNCWIWLFKNGGMKISKERLTSSMHFPQFGLEKRSSCRDKETT